VSEFESCAGCKTTEGLVYWRMSTSGNLALCRKCKTGPSAGTPDVWYGYGSGIHTEENIADPVTGSPIPFWDKASKQAAMRKAGIHEIGDRIHGARNEDTKRKKYFI
jgi:hypothetical protein